MPLELGPVKRQAVLSALLLSQGAMVSHERLLDAVWGLGLPAGGRKVLPTHVNSQRRTLDPDGTPPAESVIRSGKGWYRFAVEGVRLDTTDLEERGGEAMRSVAAGDLTTAADQLSAVIGLFRGEPLAGLPGPFAQEERRRWEERRRTLRLEWLKCLVLLGRYGEALDGLSGVASASDRYDEPLTTLRIRALYGCGRQAEALNAFEDMRVRLRDELGADPGEELRRVHEAVLHQDNTFLLRPPTPSPPRESAVPAELPHNAAGFVGRTGELIRLHALFPPEQEQGPANTVVISAIGGAAGIGKTALAVHWAHQARDRFPDGQLYVNLHGFDHDRQPLEPREALELLLRALVPARGARCRGNLALPGTAPGLGHGGQPGLPSATGSSPWLEAEQANLLAVIRHAAHHGPRPVAWHMVNALFGYFLLRLPRAAWQATTQTALDAATAEDDLFGLAAMHFSLGLIQADRGGSRPSAGASLPRTGHQPGTRLGDGRGSCHRRPRAGGMEHGASRQCARACHHRYADRP